MKFAARYVLARLLENGPIKQDDSQQFNNSGAMLVSLRVSIALIRVSISLTGGIP